MKSLGGLLALGILLGALPSAALPPGAADVRASLARAYPGARIAYDDLRGLRRISNLRQAPGTRDPAGRVSSVLARVGPAAWPGISLQAGAVRVQASRRITRVEAPLEFEGRPIVDAALVLELDPAGLLKAVGASLGPVSGVVRPAAEAPDEAMRAAACRAIRNERPGAPCAAGAAVRRAWYRSADGTLQAGALVSLPSPTLDHSPEVLLDAGGEAIWTRDRARR